MQDHLDAMAWTKMNVFHWHIVDDQSFPLQTHQLPELSRRGAFSQQHIYSREDVAEIITYAKDRGIRVIPELDTPGQHCPLTVVYIEQPNTVFAVFAFVFCSCLFCDFTLFIVSVHDITVSVHILIVSSCSLSVSVLVAAGHTASWGKGYPELLTQCYDEQGMPNGQLGPLNPTRNSTYNALWLLLREAAQLFPDTYLHLGGDEVPFDCWQVCLGTHFCVHRAW